MVTACVSCWSVTVEPEKGSSVRTPSASSKLMDVSGLPNVSMTSPGVSQLNASPFNATPITSLRVVAPPPALVTVTPSLAKICIVRSLICVCLFAPAADLVAGPPSAFRLKLLKIFNIFFLQQ